MGKMLKVKINLFFSLSLVVSVQQEEEEEEAVEEEKEKQSGWMMEGEKDRSSSRRWFEAGEPRAGEHSCGSPWALWLPSFCGLGAAYRGPGEPAGASQSCGRVGRLGQPSQERGR